MKWPIILPRHRVPSSVLTDLLVHFIALLPKNYDHEQLGRVLVHAIRNTNIHVMIVPNETEPPQGWPWGSAHSEHDGGHMFTRYIEAYISPRHECFFHLILHEWVHHMLGHCGVWTSIAQHFTEYATELEVLRIAKPFVSEQMHEKMTTWAKINVLMHYAGYADSGSEYSLSSEIADWCGYEGARKAERDEEWNRESTMSLTSNDKSQLPF